MEMTHDSFYVNTDFPIVVTTLDNRKPVIKNKVKYAKKENAEALVKILDNDLSNGARLYGELFRYAREIIKDSNSAEDVVMNFYASLVEKAEENRLAYKYKVDLAMGVAGNPGIRPWAFACINNACIDYLRKKNRHSLTSLDEITFDNNDESIYIPEEEYVSPIDKIDLDEKSEKIRRYVELLPSELKELIELIYFQGLKYREAAEVLGIPEGTVKSRIHKAIIHLKESSLVQKLDEAA